MPLAMGRKKKKNQQQTPAPHKYLSTCYSYQKNKTEIKYKCPLSKLLWWYPFPSATEYQTAWGTAADKET